MTSVNFKELKNINRARASLDKQSHLESIKRGRDRDSYTTIIINNVSHIKVFIRVYRRFLANNLNIAHHGGADVT